MHTASRETVADESTLDLGNTLSLLAKEISEIAGQCESLQTTISGLLDRVEHPDLGAEIHMLQHVDRVQQTLEDISRVLNVAARAETGASLSQLEAGGAIRLESLRRRLGWSQDSDLLPATAHLSNDVDWL